MEADCQLATNYYPLFLYIIRLEIVPYYYFVT